MLWMKNTNSGKHQTKNTELEGKVENSVDKNSVAGENFSWCQGCLEMRKNGNSNVAD